MHQYLVVASSTEHGEVALCDLDARYHVARVVDKVLRIGAFLAGEQPTLGPGALRCLRTGQIYSVDFRAINFGRQPRLGRANLHTDTSGHAD